MPHEFEVRVETPIDATPEQIWEAITNGPGVDSWFMGRTEIEPREGGTARFTMGGYTQESTVTAWEPAKRLAYQEDKNPDGTFMAFEYLIEGRDGGSTVVRLVHSGFLGDDWEAEYDALSVGDAMYLDKLAQYVTHFTGRTSAYNMFLPGPQVADSDRVWGAFHGILGLSGTPRTGDPARIEIDGIEPVDGVVDYVAHPHFLGVRTADGLYRFMQGYQDTVVVEHHNFADGVDGERIGRAWESWIARTFA